MKINGKIFFLSLALFAVIACEKDKKSSDDPFDAKYSKLSVEENMENVEQAGIDLVDELGSLEDANAFKILFNMQEMMAAEPALANHRALEPARLLAAINRNKMNSNEVFSVLKSTAEDPETISDMWDQVKAKYTWNFDTEEFDSTGSDDALIFEFPGLETDETNTAVLTIDNMKVFEVSDPREDWPAELEEMPKGIQMELEYEGETLMEAEFAASYKSDGMPTEVTSTLQIEDFKFTFNVTHSPNTSASVTYNLKRGSAILIEIYLKAEGDWSEESIEDNQMTVTDTIWTWVYDYDLNEYVQVIDYIDEYEEPIIEEIIQKGNAHFTFMNIKMAGMVNFNALGEVVRDFDEIETPDEDDIDDMVEAINEYAKFVVVYVDDNKKIAEAEAYTYEDEYGDFSPMIRFVYADGTEVDLTTYMQEEMENFFDALNDLIDSINNDYGTEFEPIDPENLDL